MDTATKTGIDAAKTELKTVVQKTAEDTGDLIGNKISHKITSIGKPKQKQPSKTEDIYIPPGKRQQIIDDLRLFRKMWHYCIRMEFQKIVNFLDTALHNKAFQILLLKNGLKFMINHKKNITQIKKLELKLHC